MLQDQYARVQDLAVSRGYYIPKNSGRQSSFQIYYAPRVFTVHLIRYDWLFMSLSRVENIRDTCEPKIQQVSNVLRHLYNCNI